jgi:hypothetical protein
MPTEAPSSSTNSVLPPRAAIAQLTLELRASLQEAAAAEEADARIDTDAAVAQLRARLEPLIQARRCSLDQSLAQARTESAAAIAQARLEAEAMVAEAPSHDAQPVEVVRIMPKDNAISVYDEMAPIEASAVERYDPGPQGAPTINIVIDAEAFARVIANVLGEHLAAVRVTTPATPVVPQPTLKHARHLDVFLVGIATLIVLVILAAWIG